jgi:hypothetical protein
MLIWKSLLMSSGLGMILAAAGILAYDLCKKTLSRKAVASAGTVMAHVRKSHWRVSLALALLAWGPILIAVSLVLATDIAGVHVSQQPGQKSMSICGNARNGSLGLLRCLNSTEA